MTCQTLPAVCSHPRAAWRILSVGRSVYAVFDWCSLCGAIRRASARRRRQALRSSEPRPMRARVGDWIEPVGSDPVLTRAIAACARLGEGVEMEPEQLSARISESLGLPRSEKGVDAHGPTDGHR